MKKPILPPIASLVLAASVATPCFILAAENDPAPFLGRWALTIPGGGAGWLGVTEEKGYLDASILWGGGSVVPVESVFVVGDTLCVTRINEVKRKDASGKTVRTHRFTELLTAKVDGDTLSLTRGIGRQNGRGLTQDEFTGKRIPPLPPAPGLAKVKFGAPVQLFNGKDLSGWRLVDPNAASGWSVENGVLVNRPDKKSGKHYGNLRTDREFEDFNLKLDVNVPKNGNSGVYLRGIYEVQVSDSFGRNVDSHNMGGLYSRITPTVAAEKPAGEWQTLDVTLVDRHLTVVLNGQKIIDNQPVLGCTGGALWSDESRPGPIYLQGDHEAVDYRNIVLRPVVR
jgi:hypothetical protein